VVGYVVVGNDPSVMGYAPKKSTEKLAKNLMLI